MNIYPYSADEIYSTSDPEPEKSETDWCPKCHHCYPSFRAFCSICGTKLIPKPPNPKCQCGAELSENDNYCRWCSAKY